MIDSRLTTFQLTPALRSCGVSKFGAWVVRDTVSERWIFSAILELKNGSSITCNSSLLAPDGSIGGYATQKEAHDEMWKCIWECAGFALSALKEEEKFDA